MFTELLIAAALQAQPSPGQSNTMPLSNERAERWPGPVGTSGRWMNAPSGKTPFVVVTSIRAGQIAVRWAVDPAKKGSPDALYYVAMRQTANALEEADSRECAIAPVMADLRALPIPEIIVPGTLPIQALAAPPFGHGGVSVAFSGARQSGGEYADLVIAGTSGPVADWVPKLFEATTDCWRPMAPPEPVAPTPG